jgi:hypothetical protein
MVYHDTFSDHDSQLRPHAQVFHTSRQIVYPTSEISTKNQSVVDLAHLVLLHNYAHDPHIRHNHIFAFQLPMGASNYQKLRS